MKRSNRKKRVPAAVPLPQNASAQNKGIFPAAWLTSRWKTIFQALVIVAAGLWIYWPALRGDWLWDDELYIPNNPLLDDPARLWKIWFAPPGGTSG